MVSTYGRLRVGVFHDGSHGVTVFEKRQFSDIISIDILEKSAIKIERDT